MGIYICSKNHEMEMGYGAFMRLRRAIASCTNTAIIDHYNYLQDNIIALMYRGIKEYDARTEELYARYKEEYGSVIDFLYAPDTGSKMTYQSAEDLLRVIGEYSNDDAYGRYSFDDFKNLLKDAVETQSGFWWE